VSQNVSDAALIALAKEARSRAYAPYSKFAVGAALLSTDGEVFLGANVENISFGLTMCAERVAIGAAVARGVTSFEAVAVASDSAEPVVPCGACRQVLAEFSPELRVISTTLKAATATMPLSELFPKPAQGILG
jgi:cytidine deaminase